MDDSTLGGYLAVHDRPPAFEGSDGRAYTAAVYVDEVPGADGRYGGAVMFVRWSDAGDHAVGHLESPYVAYADSPEGAEAAVCRLSLHDLKRALDVAIASAKEPPVW